MSLYYAGANVSGNFRSVEGVLDLGMGIVVIFWLSRVARCVARVILPCWGSSSTRTVQQKDISLTRAAAF